MSKYTRISFDSNKVMEGMQEFLNSLDENHIAIDEITLKLTHEDTNKSFEINLFKDFVEFAEKLKKEKNGKSN